jgi:hypothetical protein
MFFQHQHLETLLRQAGGSSDAGKPGAYHQYFPGFFHAWGGT